MIEIENIAGRRIVVKGIGRMFFQEGVPIGMIARSAKEKGYEVSWFHVADECLKNGWPPATVLSKLEEEVRDSAVDVDFDALERFVTAGYEEQRGMIFGYLFTDRECAANWLRGKAH